MIEYHQPYNIIIQNKNNYTKNGIYIGRPSIFGNPFIINKHGSRDDVIKKYENYFNNKIENDLNFQNEIVNLFLELKNTKQLTLICWCYPQRCHGEVIKNFLLKLLEE
jgi:hypothetical protein